MRTSKKPRINCSGLRRFDSNETAFLARELESIDPYQYETLFAALLARDFIPLIEGIDPTAMSHTYRVWEPVGSAQVAAPGANDARTVQMVRREKTRTIKSITDSYGWNIDEIRAAAKNGTPLDKMLATEAMIEIARKADNMLAFGETGSDITGLLNDGNVDSTTTPVAKTGGGTAWSDASQPAEWIADITKLINFVRVALKQASFSENGGRIPAFNKWVVLLPQTCFSKLSQTPRSTTSDLTPLKWLQQNNPFIESIEEWYQLDTAGANGKGRIMVYPRDPRAVGAVLPIEFESLPPQEDEFDINVPCRGKCGGTINRYPVASAYMDKVVIS